MSIETTGRFEEKPVPYTRRFVRMDQQEVSGVLEDNESENDEGEEDEDHIELTAFITRVRHTTGIDKPSGAGTGTTGSSACQLCARACVLSLLSACTRTASISTSCSWATLCILHGTSPMV